MNYSLPKALEIGGREYEIRSDYRAALDICTALSDPELSNEGKAIVALKILYPEFSTMPRKDYQEAIEKCIWFLNAGEEESKPAGPRLMDWEQDFPLICAPVSRVIGRDVRGMDYLHWWSFLSAYMEIGECTFAQVVSIRDKQARHKTLDKSEKEWLRRNRHLVEFKRKYTQADDDLLRQWI